MIIPHSKYPVVMFPISILLTILLLTAGCINNNSHLVGNEIINTTVSGDHYNGVDIPLPNGNGSYYIFASTTERGVSSGTIYLYYSYWVEDYGSDKFGVINKSHTDARIIDLGSTDDNSNIDRIFKVPDNAISSKINIFTSERSSLSNSVSNTNVHVIIRPMELPIPPIPPSVGSIVNCSRYNKIINDRTQPPEVMQPGVIYSSNGRSWFNLPGNPDYQTFRKYDYSYYASDKYTSYTFPANLTVINESNDICEVIP